MSSVCRYEVQSDGNEIVVSGNGDTLRFSVSGPVKADNDSCDFAVWALLPIAMRKASDLHIKGCGDPLICENAHRLSRVWETWMPHMFRQVSVSFDTYSARQPSGSDVDLVFYSGGVDSTYNLLCRKNAGKKQSLLTIQGMDFRHDDDARFAALIRKTDALARSISPQRLFVKHDLYSVYKKYKLHSGISHGFALASSAFLFSGNFSTAELAADGTRAQEYDVHPWGTNSLTNPLFAGTTFRLNTANLDLTRCDKLPLIAKSTLALGALTFCKDRSYLPENCGRCTKCVRTKAMFMAAIGSVPSMICADVSLSHGLLNSLDLDSRSEQSFLLDLFVTARARGSIEQIPGLAEKASPLLDGPRPHLIERISRLYGSSLKAVTRMLPFTYLKGPREKGASRN
jgi:hypothetical protein